jgi:tetratricopeptide (TPR) repeat protein
MAAREEVDSVTQQRVFDELGKTWLATPDELAKATGLATPIVASALAGWVQAGRAIYDLDRGVYRKRELTRDPLPIETLRYANEREQRAAVLLHTGKIAVDKADTSDGGLVLAGRLADRGRTFAPTITFDVEQRLVGGDCTCDYFIRNRLHRGPCEHMLALRAAHRRGINDVVSFQKADAPREVPSAERENFQAAFRRAVLRAAELRTASRITDAIAELERIARLAPPESDEQRRIQEVIAEAKLEAGQHAGAREAAERALSLFPASALALRVKRDAIAALGDLASAIPAARHLVTVENTVERWEQLLLLCERQADWAALVGFAEEALRAHPRTPQFVLARDSARAKLPADAEIPPPADDGTARAPWWRRAWRKITGAPPAGDVLEREITKIVEALAERGTVVDRTTLVQTVRLAHAAGDTKDARVQSIGEALQKSAAIRGLPDDKQLLALLRKVVS